MNIWGIKDIVEESDGQFIRWKFKINREFYFKGRKVVGLNEKLISQARNKGVHKFVIDIEGKEYLIEPPNDARLKSMRKEKMFEKKKSLFPGSPAMIIYYLTI